MENKRKRKQVKKTHRNYDLTGEDIVMLRENNHERRKEEKRSICDTHQDGA